MSVLIVAVVYTLTWVLPNTASSTFVAAYGDTRAPIFRRFPSIVGNDLLD